MSYWRDKGLQTARVLDPKRSTDLSPKQKMTLRHMYHGGCDLIEMMEYLGWTDRLTKNGAQDSIKRQCGFKPLANRAGNRMRRDGQHSVYTEDHVPNMLSYKPKAMKPDPKKEADSIRQYAREYKRLGRPKGSTSKNPAYKKAPATIAGILERG